ncbi:hypothetical protein Tco_0227022 [Tanacetum coccineum]
MEILPVSSSNSTAVDALVMRTASAATKPYQGDSLNLPDHRIHKDGDGDALFQLKTDSLQLLYQGRLLASFQDDAKCEHVGQDTRSQGGKDDQDGRIKI